MNVTLDKLTKSLWQLFRLRLLVNNKNKSRETKGIHEWYSD